MIHLGTDEMRSSKPITVTLGEMQDRVEARVKSGAYSSASEVIRAGLRALDREEQALDDLWRQKIREAYEDPRPSIPAKEAFRELRRYHDARLKARSRGA